MECSNCHVASPPQARFCSQCGQRLIAAATSGNEPHRLANSEQSPAGDAVRAAEDPSKLLLDSIPAYISYVDAAERYCWVNKLYEQWYRRPQQEIVGKTIRELQGESNYAQMREHIRQALSGLTVRYEHDLEEVGGAVRTFDTHYVPHWSALGQVLGLFVLVFDVTSERATEKSRRMSELRYRTLFETCGDAIFVLDTSGRIQAANQAAARMHGYTVAQLTTMRIQDLDDLDSAQLAPQRIEQLRAGQVLQFEVSHRRQDGSTFPVEVVASAMRLGDETLLLAFDRDITERKNAEARLRASENQFALFMQHLPGAAWMKDAQGRYLFVNAEAERVFGRTAADCLGRRDDELFPPDTAAQFQENDRAALAQPGGISTSRLRCVQVLL